MNVQIFRGRTLSEARRALLARMGPDAVVLTTRTVRKPGVAGWFTGSEVEISAVPAQEADAAPRGKVVPFAAGAYTVPSLPQAPITPPPPDVASVRAELKGDIRALKTLLAKTESNASLLAEITALREAMEDLRVPEGKEDAATKQLRAIGIEGPALRALGRALKGKAHDAEALRAALTASVSTAAWPLDGKQAMIAVVGATGVGKTTTAAKLAARARLEGRTVTLVGCDTFRIGAVEQLSRFASLMGAEMCTARTADELQGILDRVRTDVVIVDTSGRPPLTDGVESALAPTSRKGTSGFSRNVLLCATAALRANDAARLARRYASLAPTALAITKIDETETPAGLIHASAAAKLPVAVLCAGPRVPEDIAAATLPAILDCLAPLPKGRAAA